MIDTGLPLPCPRCGRQPTLRSCFYRGGIYELRFECRRWYGRRCFVEGRWSRESKDWYDWALRNATTLWNRAVHRERLRLYGIEIPKLEVDAVDLLAAWSTWPP